MNFFLFKSEWVETVKTTLNNCGFSGLWFNQPIEVFKHSVKIQLKDRFIQKWHEII